MGKVGGFLELARRDHGERDDLEALGDFGDIAVPLGEDDQRAQAGRCMYCGVAFCQTGIAFGKARTSGCPLHNLIPEWNDLVWRGRWDDAAERLALTSPFPEFTSRVCPALCEMACNLGLNDEPTTVRDNERAISDHQWAQGGPAPLEPPAAGAPHVVVVGSGPAGLAVAWELARRGARVTVAERSDRAGGLLMYGIPNMKLPKDVVARRVALMERSGIEFRLSCDAADAACARELAEEADAVVVAAGSGAARTLSVPGSTLDGVHLAVEYLGDETRSLLDGAATPVSAEGLDVVVIGGGDTGTDCVATALRQHARSVRQLEFLPMPPETPLPTNRWPEWPNVKKTDYGQREAIALTGEDPRSWATDTLEVLGEDGHVTGLRVVSLDWSSGRPERLASTERVLPAQLVLIAMGFAGPQPQVLEAFGVPLAEKGRPLPQMEVPGLHKARSEAPVPVFCAGDARNGASLVVSAIADGLACAAEVAAFLEL